MRRSVAVVVTCASAVLLAASMVGLVTDSGGPDSGPAEPGEVAIAAFRFDPGTVTVAAGSSITWTNLDEAIHTVDSTTEGPLDSGSIEEGETYRVTFETPGTFAYACALHASMKGTVEVTEP